MNYSLNLSKVLSRHFLLYTEQIYNFKYAPPLTMIHRSTRLVLCKLIFTGDYYLKLPSTSVREKKMLFLLFIKVSTYEYLYFLIHKKFFYTKIVLWTWSILFIYRLTILCFRFNKLHYIIVVFFFFIHIHVFDHRSC